jgi:hypothetical protein
MRIFLGSSAKLDAAKPSKVRKETLKVKITPSKKLLSKNSSPGIFLQGGQLFEILFNLYSQANLAIMYNN